MTSTYPQEVTYSSAASQLDPPRRCVLKAIAASAAKTPEAIALTNGSQVLTYHDLDWKANRLAHYLRSLGVGAEVPVGLCLPRSLEMAIAALGIWKAGGAYLPMDPAYPPDHLAFTLDDAQAPVAITNSCFAPRLPTGKAKVVNIDAPEIAGEPHYAPRIEIMQGDLAYVIYTSGSTGKPKGVEITHGSLANLVGWHSRAFSVTPADRASHLAGLGFDAAVWELWPYLANGASVHMVDEITRQSAELLHDWLLQNGITISFVPTPLAERLLRLNWPTDTALRALLTGGDTLHHYPPATLPFKVINNYGPTECTVVATSGPVLPGKDPSEPPPIGRAIAGAKIYLLDQKLEPVPAGTAGEIYIGGAGLARGYRYRSDLTAAKFVPNPFSAKPGERLYKTGDLGRLLPNGQIAFLGRADDQIKIRGYRIEPNEIVSALNRHPAIRDSLVIARADASGDLQLVAYVILHALSTHSALREFLSGQLPEYMLPAAFVRMDGFQLTPHGKVDRAALPALDRANTLCDEVSTWPCTPVEQRVAEILTGLLGREQIGREDNFFLVGGHSMLGAQLITRLRDAFGIELSLRALFEAPTIAELAAKIERSEKSGSIPPRLVPSSAASTLL